MTINEVEQDNNIYQYLYTYDIRLDLFVYRYLKLFYYKLKD